MQMKMNQRVDVCLDRSLDFIYNVMLINATLWMPKTTHKHSGGWAYSNNMPELRIQTQWLFSVEPGKLNFAQKKF